MKKAKKIKPVKAWAGCMYRGHTLTVDRAGESMEFGEVGMFKTDQIWSMAVYERKADAQKRYECVIPVLIVPITPKRRKKK